MHGAIARNQQVVGRDMTVLQHATVTAYIDGGTTANVTPLFADQRADGDTSEYQSVLSGTVTGAVDQLASDRQALQARQATLQRVEAQDQATTNQSAQLLSQAESTQQTLQQQSAQVQGALAAAVAQQQAQEAVAAAAAVAAAQAKAASQATGPVGRAGRARPRSPGPSATTTAPALNSFLQCVVQHESGGDYQVVVAHRPVHGGVPVQPVDVERGSLIGRASHTDRGASEPGVAGRAGCAGRGPLQRRRRFRVVRPVHRAIGPR